MPTNHPLTNQRGSWEVVSKILLGDVLPALQASGYAKFGAIGFCWGAKMVVQACASAPFAAGALLHPSRLTEDDIKASIAPLLFLPAGNDPDMLPFLELLSSKPFAAACGHERFQEQSHGWTVRGDLTVAATARDVARAQQLSIDFFKATL